MTFNKALESILTFFGGTKYLETSVPSMKKQIDETLSQVESCSPAEKAMVTKLKGKVARQKSKEKILMAITEQMFTLSGEGA